MLAKDGKLIDRSHPDFEQINKELEQIRKSTKPFIIQSKQKIPTVFNDRGQRVKTTNNRVYSLPLKAYVPDKNGGLGSEFMLFKSFNDVTREANEITGFARAGQLVMNSVEPLHPRSSKSGYDSAELIYFIMHCSDLFPKKIFHHDPDKALEDKIDIESMEAHVKYMILAPHSPISLEATGEEKTIRDLAFRWGVKGLNNMNFNDVKYALWEAVQRSEKNKANTNRGYKEFLAECDKKEGNEKAGNIRYAIDKDIFKFSQREKAWFIHTSTGEKKFLIGVDNESDKEEVLMEYMDLKSSQKYYDLMMDAMKNGVSRTSNDTSIPQQAFAENLIDVDTLDTRDKLESHGEENDVTVFGRKLEDVRKELVEKFPDKYYSSKK